MAEILYGDSQLFNAMVVPQAHPSTIQFLQHQLERPTQHLTQAGQSFIQQSQEFFQRFDYQSIARQAQAVKRAVGGLWQSDEIRYLATIDAIQNAPQKMLRGLMACPEVRQAYQEERIEGYYGLYTDPHSGQIGEEHHDYRRVMNGITTLNDDDTWGATTYFDEALEEDEPITEAEQHDILDTWEVMRANLVQGRRDFTSPSDGEIG